jgi:hypothetical protein
VDRLDAQPRAITASGMRAASVEVLARCAAALSRLSMQGVLSRDSRRVLTVYRVDVAGWKRGPSAYFPARP